MLCELCSQHMHPHDYEDHVRVLHPEDFKVLVEERREREASLARAA